MGILDIPLPPACFFLISKCLAASLSRYCFLSKSRLLMPNLLLFSLQGGLLSYFALDNLESVKWVGAFRCSPGRTFKAVNTCSMSGWLW